MAIMFPENQVFFAAESEREMYMRLMSELPADVRVYYSVSWNSDAVDSQYMGEGDFIILDPNFGFIVLEVKGGYKIECFNGRWTLWETPSSFRKLSKSPYEQARASMHTFAQKYQEKYFEPIPVNYAFAVCFPHYNVDSTETLNGEWELTLVHPIDERDKWRKLTDGGILRVPVPAAMTPQINLVTQQYQTTTYDVEVYKVSTSRDPLRLRSGTGTKYKILGKYKKGTEVIVIEKTSSSWYEVTCPDGKHGYMSSEYLTYVRTEQQSTTTNVGFRNDVVEARQLRDQPFRIYRVVPELDKVTVYARHIFYDLLDNMIKQIKPASDAVGASVVKSISDGCLSEHDFTFYSDLESTASDVSFENINPVEALLGENGLTSKYGAELVRDWFDVFLVSRVGTDSEVQIREKKNLTGISIDVDMTDAVTRIMPTGEDADGNVLYLPELYIDSPNIGAFPHPKWIHLPVSEAKEVAEGDNYKSLTSCYQDMRRGRTGRIRRRVRYAHGHAEGGLRELQGYRGVQAVRGALRYLPR